MLLPLHCPRVLHTGLGPGGEGGAAVGAVDNATNLLADVDLMDLGGAAATMTGGGGGGGGLDLLDLGDVGLGPDAPQPFQGLDLPPPPAPVVTTSSTAGGDLLSGFGASPQARTPPPLPAHVNGGVGGGGGGQQQQQPHRC